MPKPATYFFSFGIVICSLLLGFSLTALAQETDTSSVKIEDEQEPRSVDINRNIDRSMSRGTMTEMGTYSMPYKTQYYHAPFEAQKSLDRAVKAYRKEMEKRIGVNGFWNFLDAMVNNKFEFGVYQIYDLPVADRDNPLFKSYNSKKKRQ